MMIITNLNKSSALLTNEYSRIAAVLLKKEEEAEEVPVITVLFRSN